MTDEKEQPLAVPAPDPAHSTDADQAALVTHAPPAGQEPSPASAPEPPAGGDKRWRAWVLVGVIAVVFVVFGVLIYNSFTVRLAASKQVDAAEAKLEKVDVVVVRVDKVVRSEITSDLAKEALDASGAVGPARSDLEQIVADVDEALPNLTNDEQKRYKLLRAAAVARIDMLKLAPVILAANVKASQALVAGQAGWNGTLNADKLSDQAVAEYNKLTKGTVTSSQKLNKQAADELAAARSSFVQAEAAFPEAPFEAYIAFVDARIALNKLSQQSDAAWLAGDVAKANSIIATYNTEDKKAVVLAKALPATPEQAIADAYKALADKPTDEYYAARDAATKADRALREF